jgi:hypothetical protein
VRVARVDVIESDLWSQHEEAGATDRSEPSLAREIVMRLVLGLASDVAWRLDQGRLHDQPIARSATIGTRVIALLATLGGLGISVGAARSVVTVLADPTARPWDGLDEAGGAVLALIGEAGLIALSISLLGLGFVLINRFESPVGLLSVLGALGGLTGLLGAYSMFVLLPSGSAVVVLYLAHIRAVHWGLALIHAGSAPGLVLLIWAYSDNSLFGTAALMTFVYCLSWVAIGLELIQGLPTVRLAAQSGTRRAPSA